MRLVGASNMAIRLPFIAETIIAAVVGAAMAVGLLFAAVRALVGDNNRNGAQSGNDRERGYLACRPRILRGDGHRLGHPHLDHHPGRRPARLAWRDTPENRGRRRAWGGIATPGSMMHVGRTRRNARNAAWAASLISASLALHVVLALPATADLRDDKRSVDAKISRPRRGHGPHVRGAGQGQPGAAGFSEQAAGRPPCAGRCPASADRCQCAQ